MVQFLCSYGNAAARKEVANATSKLYASPAVMPYIIYLCLLLSYVKFMVILLYLYYHSSIILIFLSMLINYISIFLYLITAFIITIFISLGTYSSTRKSTCYYLASLSPFIVFFHVFRSPKVTKRLHRIKLVLFRVPAGVHYIGDIMEFAFTFLDMSTPGFIIWCMP
ncbi:Uncharacterised protein [Clostridium carnis]|uniref:Uncharacterized protein n=1 Tax=Clostridium carnis TaxID=1530 RepID=A0ABY6SU89_9CLOT|nr:Uncharacterised protein [Clostridium carnis]